MRRANRTLGALAACAVAVLAPVATTATASAETFPDYQANCFRHGKEASPYYPQITIPTQQLALNSTGDCVKYLQDLLDTRGWSFNGGFPYSLAIDGQFGPQTNAAVRSFQKGTGIEQDGQVGPQTWTALGDARD